ncbi:heat-inducible transcriptional repressor HrcA [Alkalilimnicola sp. S0819]|uniref:heat-inducible transcriptional repressor HrcA n=1 Tax=Alkalilimnicola sp. S0819 TaxID=2613922 RepID=UPI00126216F6|nr:heat-inducible transcriptional repressor HrcA [Alkalilimnicola sp. S0819]KAB7627905.1 heat-inducible transcriptional repressor HrcA [Alkalilimnicola sp. S0819]MPQ15541.1 heat-inducible transcriptional repressor HrcA [Alkalilimnicola sp. S0819]
MARKGGEYGLSERAQHLLKVLVQRHIRDGQPVGSRTLTRESGLSVSAATIRNVMSDLDELGYVVSPHTSAGRIPTEKGYRFFVDSLLTVNPLQPQDVERLKIQLDAEAGTDALVDSASNLLSSLTHYAGLVTLPRRDHAALRQVEFLPLSENRLLAILVVNEQEVQNRILETERPYSESELRQISNFLNAQFAGKDVLDVRRQLLADMKHHQAHLNELMGSVISVGEKLFTDTPREEDYVVAGQTNLMEFAELSNVEKLRGLFDAFARKRDILNVLDRCLVADGVQIYIGQESGVQIFDGCSLVTSTYAVEGEAVGVLGVIGPTRMAYDRVIPIVDMTARLLGTALNRSR